MRKELIASPSEIALGRVLAGLERELVEATDEDIAAAAADLGVDPAMKGSAAFLGLLHARPRRIEDIFDVESLRAADAGYLKGGKDRD